MKISKKYLDTKSVLISLTNDLEATEGIMFKSELENLIDNGMEKIFINLEDLEYIDSAGLGVLIYGSKKLSEKSGEIVLVSPTKPVRKILELTSLDKIFNIKDDINELLIN